MDESWDLIESVSEGFPTYSSTSHTYELLQVSQVSVAEPLFLLFTSAYNDH